jgi:hypothetical protein
MVEPWRVGRALVLPVFPRNGLALGIWRKRPPTEDGTLVDASWLSPRWLPIDVDEIGGWTGATGETEEP